VRVDVCRLNQQSVVANGRPESPHVTNGICDGSESFRFVPADSVDQPLTVLDSQKLPLSAQSHEVVSDTASQDGSVATFGSGDVVNGNYVSSSEEQAASPQIPISRSPEHSVQKPFEIGVVMTVSTGNTQDMSKQHMGSSDEDVQSLAAAAAAAAPSDKKTIANSNVMDAKQAATPPTGEILKSDRAVDDEKDATSFSAGDKTSPSDKQASLMPVSGESVITCNRTEISAARVGAIESASADASPVSGDKTGKLISPEEKVETVSDSVKVEAHDKRRFDDSAEKLPSFTAETARRQEATVAEDLTKKLYDDRVDDEAFAKKLPTDDETYSADAHLHRPYVPEGSRSLPKDKADGVQAVTKAVKTGLLAVVGAPVIAGMAVADALRSDSSPSTIAPLIDEAATVGGVVSTEQSISSVNKDTPQELVASDNRQIARDAECPEMSIVGPETQPSAVSQAPENTPVTGDADMDGLYAADVGISELIVESVDESDKTIPQQEVTNARSAGDVSKPRESLPCSDEPVSISNDQDDARQAEISTPETAVSNNTVDIGDSVMDTGENDFSKTRSEDSHVRLPECTHYDDGVDANDEEYDLGDDEDEDEVDSAADEDDDTTSQQVAPRSVKMHDVAKGKQSASMSSTVVCARPSRGSARKAPKTVTEAGKASDGDESDENKEPDSEESSAGLGADAKIQRPEYTERTPLIDLTDLTEDRQSSADRPLAPRDAFRDEELFPTLSGEISQSHGTAGETDASPDTVNRGVEDTEQAVKADKSRPVAVSDNQSTTLLPKEEIARDLRTSDFDAVQGDRIDLLHPLEVRADAKISGPPAGRVPDLQGSVAAETVDSVPIMSPQTVVEWSEHVRTTQPQEMDSRPADAGLTVLRPWEIQQQTDAGDDERYSAINEHPVRPAVPEDGRSPSKDKADGVHAVTKAVKTGLMAVVGAPVIAGMAIADALRSDTSPSTATPRSPTPSDHRPAEMMKPPAEDWQRKQVESRDDASLSSESHATEEALHLLKPIVPSQPAGDAVQEVDSEVGKVAGTAATAVSFSALINADAVAVDSSAAPVHQTSDRVKFQQPMSEQTSAAAGFEQPPASEIYDDRSSQSYMKMEPLLPFVASTQPSEITTTSSGVSSVVSTQPLMPISDSTPKTVAGTQLPMQVTDFAARTAVSTESSLSTVTLVKPVMETSPVTLATVGSTLPSESTPSTAASTQLTEQPFQSSGVPALDSFVETVPASLPATASTSPSDLTADTETRPTSSAVTLSQSLNVTAQSAAPAIPSFEQFSQTLKSTLPCEEYTASLTLTSRTSAFSQPLMSTLQYTASDVVSAQPSTMPGVESTVPLKQTLQTTVQTMASNAQPSLPTDSAVSSVALSQPLLVTAHPAVPAVASQEMQPTAEIVQPTSAATAVIKPSPDSVQTVPSTEPFTETTLSIPATAVASSTQMHVPVVSVVPVSSLQATSLVTTASGTAPAVTSDEGSEISISATTQRLEFPSQSELPSDQPEVTALSSEPSEVSQLPQIPARSERDDGFIVDRSASFQDGRTDWLPFDSFIGATFDPDSQEVLGEEKEANVADETTDKTRYRQHAATDTEQSPATSVELDQEHFDHLYDRAEVMHGRFQPENQLRDDSASQSSVGGSVKTAVQYGLLGLVGAPVLAGKAIADAVKSKLHERQHSQTARPLQGLSENDVTIGQQEFDPSEFKKSEVKSQEPGSTALQSSVTSSIQPFAPAAAVLADAPADHKCIDTQAGTLLVGDQWKLKDEGKEVRDEPEIAGNQYDATDETENNFGRSIQDASLPGLSLSEALLSPLYNQQHNCFIDPTSGRRISIASAVQLGLIDGNKKVIADLNSGEVISVMEALSRGIIDSETGMVSVDGEAYVPLNEALASGLIMDDTDGDLLEMAASIGTGGRMWNEEPSIISSVEEPRTLGGGLHQASRQPSRRPLKLVQVLDLGLYNSLSGEFRDLQTSDLLSLAEAIRYCLLDKDSMVINDPQSEEVLSLEESIRGGLVSGSTSLVHDTSTSERIPLTEALRRGILIPRPMSIATAINIGLCDESNGMFFDPTNGLYFALEEAVEGGLIDPHSLVIDPATGKAMAVAAALACGILDARHGNVVNIHTGEVIPLSQMAVGSQAVFGSEPVGVSSQVAAAASVDVEEGIKPTAARPDVHRISDSVIVGTSGSSSDVSVTADDRAKTNDITDSEVKSVECDTSKSTSLNDQTSGRSFVDDESDQPASLLVSATATSVSRDDGAKPASAVDGVSSMVTLQNILSSPVAAAVSDIPAKLAQDVVDTRDDIQPLSSIIQAEMKPPSRDEIKQGFLKDEAADNEVLKGDSKKGALKVADATDIAEPRDNVQQPSSNIMQIEMKLFPEDTSSDTFKEDDLSKVGEIVKDETTEDVNTIVMLQGKVAITEQHADDTNVALEDIMDDRQKPINETDTARQRGTSVDREVDRQLDLTPMDTQLQQGGKSTQGSELSADEKVSTTRRDEDELTASAIAAEAEADDKKPVETDSATGRDMTAQTQVSS